MKNTSFYLLIILSPNCLEVRDHTLHIIYTKHWVDFNLLRSLTVRDEWDESLGEIS